MGGATVARLPKSNGPGSGGLGGLGIGSKHVQEILKSFLITKALSLDIEVILAIHVIKEQPTAKLGHHPPYSGVEWRRGTQPSE